MNTPRVMIAAVKSGSGKTTITCALLEQMKKTGSPVSFKCGPDYIDPMFHEQVLHIPSRNLDGFFSTPDQIRALFLADQREGQISVLEGVMGLYDGIGGICEEGSSYQLAKILEAPIILVVDAHGMGRSILPLLFGFLQYDQKHLIQGVILNRTSEMFFKSIAPEIEKELGIEVYGCFPKQKDIQLKSRHLGLVLPGEVAAVEESLKQAGAILAEHVNVEKVIALAHRAPQMSMPARKIEQQIFGKKVSKKENTGYNEKQGVRIAVAKDEAFCFYYQDNFRILTHFGAELVPFSPLHDKELPEGIQGLILGGGYPELHAEELSANKEMRKAITEAIHKGVPSIAECGGFMYLHEELIDEAGQSHKMAGVIPGSAFHTGKLVRFGYLELAEHTPHFLPGDTTIKGHEFHYYDSTANGEDCQAVKPVTGRSWECIQKSDRHFWGFPHLYYASNPAFAGHFVDVCRRWNKAEL